MMTKPACIITIPDPTDSQSFNRYSYCGNNPLNETDPSGFDPAGGITIGGDGGDWNGNFWFGNTGYGYFGSGSGGNPVTAFVPWSNPINPLGWVPEANQSISSTFGTSASTSDLFWQNVSGNWGQNALGYFQGWNSASLAAVQTAIRNANPILGLYSMAQSADAFLSNPLGNVRNGYHNFVNSLQTSQGIGGVTFAIELSIMTGGEAAPETAGGALTVDGGHRRPNSATTDNRKI
jgi:hypothetical protein